MVSCLAVKKTGNYDMYLYIKKQFLSKRHIKARCFFHLTVLYGLKLDGLIPSSSSDGKVKSSICKARES